MEENKQPDSINQEDSQTTPEATKPVIKKAPATRKPKTVTEVIPVITTNDAELLKREAPSNDKSEDVAVTLDKVEDTPKENTKKLDKNNIKKLKKMSDKIKEKEKEKAKKVKTKQKEKEKKSKKKKKEKAKKEKAKKKLKEKKAKKKAVAKAKKKKSKKK
jgi:septal ring factor EnvC (AmiA/AmiB activator)